MFEIELLFEALSSNDVEPKAMGIEGIYMVSADEEQCKLILCKYRHCLPSVVILTCDANKNIAKFALGVLANISIHEDGQNVLLGLEPKYFDGLSINNTFGASRRNILTILFNHMSDTCPKFVHKASAVLVNLTQSNNINTAISIFNDFEPLVTNIIQRILGKNEISEDLYQYIPYILLNLSANVEKVRIILMDTDKEFMWSIIPLTKSHMVSERYAGLGIIRNLLLIPENHKKLLESDYDILGVVLYPLAAAADYTDEENNKFPIDLQYLDTDKQREQDPSVRMFALESLYQLCSTRHNRTYIRDKNAYLILREYHKWETNEDCLKVCEDVVNVLIRTEEEIGADDLTKVTSNQNTLS